MLSATENTTVVILLRPSSAREPPAESTALTIETSPWIGASSSKVSVANRPRIGSASYKVIPRPRITVSVPTLVQRRRYALGIMLNATHVITAATPSATSRVDRSRTMLIDTASGNRLHWYTYKIGEIRS